MLNQVNNIKTGAFDMKYSNVPDSRNRYTFVKYNFVLPPLNISAR